MPLRIGETFAGYRILRLLGSGGMGEVYLVQHPRLPRQDALKVLGPDVSGDTSFRERFVREADLAAGLRHPNIVGVHDRGEHDGHLWIAMDYIDGTDAAQLIQQRYPAGMPIKVALPIVTAVASALDYAHRKGLLHRDVKPANIIVADLDSDDRSVFLADFGIARPVDDISGITTTNMTVGTVAYAAPEQLLGEEMLDGRVDQYALAATAYHLLTGSQLFPNSNPAVVISRHLHTTPPALSDHRPDCAGLDAVLQIALAKNPSDRFPSCSAFAQALVDETPDSGAASANAATQSAPQPPKSAPTSAPRPGAGAPATGSRRAWVVVGGAAAIMLLVGAALLVGRSWESRQTDSQGTTSTTAATGAPAPPPAPPPTPPTATTTMPTSVEPVQPYALPGCYRGREDVSLTERPTESPIACRHHFFEGLTWMTWGAAGAEGNGIEQTQNCTPNCAQGEIFRNRVHVLFTGSTSPPPESGCPTTFRYYTQLIVAYPDLVEIPSGASYGTDTRYNGMPAVRYNDLQMLCTEGHN